MTSSSDRLLLERFALCRELAREMPVKGCFLVSKGEESVSVGTGTIMKTNGAITGLALRKALVISASEENRVVLSEGLVAAGFVPALCSSITEARKFIESDDTSIVFCDDCVHDGCLKNVVTEVAKRRRPIRVIAVSRTGEWDEYFEALSMGAFDYLSLPPRHDELDRVLASALGWDGRPNDETEAEAASSERACGRRGN